MTRLILLLFLAALFLPAQTRMNPFTKKPDFVGPPCDTVGWVPTYQGNNRYQCQAPPGLTGGEANITGDQGGGVSLRATTPKVGIRLDLRTLASGGTNMLTVAETGDLINITPIVNAANALLQLDAGGMVPTNRIPDLSGSYLTPAQAAATYLTQAAAAAGYLTPAAAAAAYAPISKGVTNGDAHAHTGGAGAQIDYNSLSNRPTIPNMTLYGPLASANTWTRGQKFYGSQDEIQVDVQGASGQAQPIFRVRDFAGNVLAQIGPTGGPLQVDALEGLASDTHPACAAGKYYFYVDLSETKWKKCTNGTESDADTTSAGSGGEVGAYDATGWDGDSDAPTKDAIRDKIVAVDAAVAGKAASNASTTVNGQPCALGGSCTVTADPSSAQFKMRPCEIAVGDPGTASAVLADDNDSPAVCGNVFGVSLGILEVKCAAFPSNVGSPAVLPIIKGGAANSILSSALVCGNADFGSAGTLNGTPSQADGASIDANIFTAGGTAKYIVIRIKRTL